MIEKDGKPFPENYQEAHSLGFYGYNYVLKRPYMKNEEKDIDKLTRELEDEQERELIKQDQDAIAKNDKALEDAKGIIEDQVARFEKLMTTLNKNKVEVALPSLDSLYRGPKPVSLDSSTLTGDEGGDSEKKKSLDDLYPYDAFGRRKKNSSQII